MVHKGLLVCSVQEEDAITTVEAPEVEVLHVSLVHQAKVKPLLDQELFRETPDFTSLGQHRICLNAGFPALDKLDFASSTLSFQKGDRVTQEENNHLL